MMKKNKILIVDDEIRIRNILKLLFEKNNFYVQIAESGEKAVEISYKENFDVVLLDMNMKGINGLETMQQLQPLQENAQYIFVTAFGTVHDAVEAIKNGAYNFVTKPFDNDELLGIVNGALQMSDLVHRLNALESQLFDNDPFNEIIGNSKELKAVLNLTEKIAKTDLTVLITGESGTGKDLIARAIHKISNRRKNKIIPVNCAAIPKYLFESEFFGYKKGAFTGAVKNQKGKFTEANGGTLFLDEIGEIPLEFQAKLLRVLENGEINPVGDNQPNLVDVRIIAATNKDLAEKVKNGTFREDLFYRLNVFEIDLPPLRKRKSDIELLANYFLKKKYPEKSLANSAVKFLKNYDWPGNIRQLKNEIERAAILAENNILLPKDFSFQTEINEENELPEISLNFNLDDVLNEIRRKYLLKALRLHKGNKKKAAESLGISYRIYNYQLEKLI